MNKTQILFAFGLAALVLFAPDVAFASTSTGTPLDGIIGKITNFVSGPMAYLMLLGGIGGIVWAAIGNQEMGAFVRGLIVVVAAVAILMGAGSMGRSFMGIGAEVVGAATPTTSAQKD